MACCVWTMVRRSGDWSVISGKERCLLLEHRDSPGSRWVSRTLLSHHTLLFRQLHLVF